MGEAEIVRSPGCKLAQRNGAYPERHGSHDAWAGYDERSSQLRALVRRTSTNSAEISDAGQ